MGRARRATEKSREKALKGGAMVLFILLERVGWGGERGREVLTSGCRQGLERSLMAPGLRG